MAASSPALSNNTAVAANSTATIIAGTKTMMFSASSADSAVNLLFHSDTLPKTQRGLNKPKCKQCGNVARSRLAISKLHDFFQFFKSTSKSLEKDTEMIISRLKFHLRSNLIKNDSFRRRMQQIVDHGEKKVESCELNDSDEVVNIEKEFLRNGVKKAKNRGLIHKLNKARNEEDLRTCSRVEGSNI